MANKILIDACISETYDIPEYRRGTFKALGGCFPELAPQLWEEALPTLITGNPEYHTFPTNDPETVFFLKVQGNFIGVVQNSLVFPEETKNVVHEVLKHLKIDKTWIFNRALTTLFYWCHLGIETERAKEKPFFSPLVLIAPQNGEDFMPKISADEVLKSPEEAMEKLNGLFNKHRNNLLNLGTKPRFKPQLERDCSFFVQRKIMKLPLYDVTYDEDEADDDSTESVNYIDKSASRAAGKIDWEENVYLEQEIQRLLTVVIPTWEEGEKSPDDLPTKFLTAFAPYPNLVY
jgi:hypothetical protein